MKINVKKEGKVKSFNLIKSWDDVTLDSWIKLMDYQKGSKSEEAIKSIRLLSDMPRKLVKELAIKDIAVIMGKVAEMQKKADGTFKKIIKVNGVEYGMHPNLEDITLGEWADIETFIKDGIEKNMPEIMAVLYRPVLEKKNKAYTIPAYDGNITIRAEEFKSMKAAQVQSSLVFFWSLGKELLKILPSYLMAQTEEIKKELQMKILQKNGVTLD